VSQSKTSRYFERHIRFLLVRVTNVGGPGLSPLLPGRIWAFLRVCHDGFRRRCRTIHDLDEGTLRPNRSCLQSKASRHVLPFLIQSNKVMIYERMPLQMHVIFLLRGNPSALDQTVKKFPKGKQLVLLRN
jgi:hypothetical protein